ncbi:caldesmon-like [Montipora foliosa]|uniref:caldesmon-like n=1 Tax=Montipora foliosa TaxID=591990 RepID=UPI0035F1416A
MQEVYDWAGSIDDLPLHFTIQRRQQVVLHNDPLQGHEVLDVREGEEEEIRSILQTEVSFRGNLPQVEINKQALSDTVADGPQRRIAEEAKAGKEEREEEEKVEEIETQKRQLEETVGENEKGQENVEEKGQMEGTTEEGESIKRKNKKDKRTTAERRKEEEDVKELQDDQVSFRGNIHVPQAEEEKLSDTFVDETQREKPRKKRKVKERTPERRKEKHASGETKREKGKASKKAMKISKTVKKPENQEDDCTQENKEAQDNEDAQEQVEDETEESLQLALEGERSFKLDRSALSSRVVIEGDVAEKDEDNQDAELESVNIPCQEDGFPSVTADKVEAVKSKEELLMEQLKEKEEEVKRLNECLEVQRKELEEELIEKMKQLEQERELRKELENLYGGCISDKEITSKSGFIDKLQQGDEVMADRGFNIQEMLACKGVKVNVPPFMNQSGQFTEQEIALGFGSGLQALGEVAYLREAALQVS